MHSWFKQVIAMYIAKHLAIGMCLIIRVYGSYVQDFYLKDMHVSFAYVREHSGSALTSTA